MSEDVTDIGDETPDEAAAETAEPSRLDKARERFSQVTTGVEEKLGKLKQEAGGAGARARERAEQVGGTARERYDSTVETVRQGYGKAQKDLEHLTEDVNEYVRHNPGRSVLIAAGVGFLVGMLMRGGRR